MSYRKENGLPRQCAHWLAMTCRRQKGVCGCKDVARNAMQKEGRVRGCKDAARKVRGNMPGVSGGKAPVRNDMQKIVALLRVQEGAAGASPQPPTNSP